MKYKGFSVDPARNRFRFYSMHIEQNLFGECVLVCNRGRIGHPGQVKVHYGSLEECEKKFNSLVKKRENNGYEPGENDGK